jgi:hypothetical protein
MIAYTERRWFAAMSAARIHRYEFSADGFEDLGDAGMWVCRREARPLRRDMLDDLPAALRAADVELRLLDDLLSLKDVWSTSLHASGIRLRNAHGWNG